MPTVKNGFKQGMKLEGIDPQHPSMYFVLTVAEVSQTSINAVNGSSWLDYLGPGNHSQTRSGPSSSPVRCEDVKLAHRGHNCEMDLKRVLHPITSQRFRFYWYKIVTQSRKKCFKIDRKKPNHTLTFLIFVTFWDSLQGLCVLCFQSDHYGSTCDIESDLHKLSPHRHPPPPPSLSWSRFVVTGCGSISTATPTATTSG